MNEEFIKEVRRHLNLDHPDWPEVFKLSEAEKQQEAIRKIMAEKKVPFEQAVDIYIRQKRPSE